LAVSYQPLTVDAIGEALAIDNEKSEFHKEARLANSEDILEICGGLVSFVEVESVINIATRPITIAGISLLHYAVLLGARVPVPPFPTGLAGSHEVSRYLPSKLSSLM
jgi:hypothetical protein